MRKQIIFIVALFAVVITSAQNAGLVLETWEPSLALHTIDSKYSGESAVILLDKRRIEYIDEKEELVTYRTLHKIIHIISDNGIEAFNRVYLPVADNKDIVSIKARTILPGGKIIEISSENIKDLKDDEQIYKIFAMEGLVKGCEVEFFYTYKRNTAHFGRENIQGPFPILEAKVELVSPARLVYDMRSYNAATKPLDTVLGEKRFVSFTAKNIAGVEEEKYSAFEANLLRCEYKLSYNLSRSKNEKLFTWDELAKRVYSRYTSCTDKETKKAGELVNDLKLNKLGSELEKIIAIENYLKKNIVTRDDINSEDGENIEKIIKTKLASNYGITRLYGAIFRQLGINHEFVLAGNRQKMLIERNFENWNNCDNHVIFFPGLKKYLAPTEVTFRFPWINPEWGNTNAIFCKSTTINNFTTAFAEIKPIPLEDYTLSVINMDGELELNNSADTLLINIKQIYSGYSASTYKSLFTFSGPEDQRLAIKEMIKFGTKSENVLSSKLENADFENYYENKPFVLSASVKATELLEKAGNKIIIRVGDVIGPQVEMYQEKPRQFPMEIDFPHVLERKIKFTIPNGYVIKNPDDLKIDHVYKENGQVTMGFVSGYKLEGNTLIISILEEYRKTNYPLSQYEEFRKIINAAADFNKIAIVLEKK